MIAEAHRSQIRTVDASAGWLDAYFERLGDVPGGGCEERLREIHAAQVREFPFDMLDFFLGVQPTIEITEIAHKIVYGRRGGGCTQLNELLAYGLGAVGIRTYRALARVPQLGIPVPPATHKILIAETGSRRWLCDAGFGYGGPIYPMPIEHNYQERQGEHTYCVIQIGPRRFELRKQQNEEQWRQLFSFHLREVAREDFGPIQYYNTYSPNSLFRREMVCGRPTLEGGISACNEMLVCRTHGSRIIRKSGSFEEWKRALQDYLGIVILGKANENTNLWPTD